jgi:hypothetical protein
MADKEFGFSLTYDEANVVTTALANMPYKTSAPVITKLQEQFSKQVPEEGQEQPKEEILTE